MKKIALILCTASLLVGCSSQTENSFIDDTTESVTTTETVTTVKEEVTIPTTEPPIRQLSSQIKEIYLDHPENSEYPRYKNEFTYGSSYEIGDWGKIVEDKNIYLETSSDERTELITIPDANPLSYVKIGGIIDINRFYYSVIEEEFVIGCGIYDLSTGKVLRITDVNDGESYVPLAITSESLILTRCRKTDLTGYAVLDLDTYDVTDIDLPDMKNGYHMVCCAVSPNGRAVAGITRSVSGEDYEYTVSIVNLKNGDLLSEYSFISENDYSNFELWFNSEKELYVYVDQFLYIVSLDDEITNLVTEEAYQSPVEAYKAALQAKTDYVHYYSPGNLIITYTLYDTDKDGTPELLIKYGTCEADFRITIYTYKNGKLEELSDDIPGSHTSFAYDYITNQLVLAQGHMGYGFMKWYDIDENGELRCLDDTGTLDFNSAGSPTYADYMEQYNVAWLDFSEFFQLGENKKTWLYDRSADELQSEEYEGFDYRFLENYPF